MSIIKAEEISQADMCNLTQQAKTSGFRGESPGIMVVGGGNPRGNLGCKWNENPHGNSGENF